MKFKCKNCGWPVLEEIMEGVSQSATVVDFDAVDENVCCDYGMVSYSGGDYDTIRFECGKCGQDVSLEEMIAMGVT